tara:strand:+ start:7820 stop:8470 length:651 start_codon:yes stop_codon:yes gene_type:complete
LGDELLNTFVIGILWFVLGCIIGHIIPRVPILFFTRSKSQNFMFPPHPEPISINHDLLARILNLRKLYWMSIFFTFPALFFGWIMITWADSAMGFGLFLASGWTIVSRLLPDSTGNKYLYPYSLNLIFDLNLLINSRRLKDVLVDEDVEIDTTLICCKLINPLWEVGNVRCSNCNRILLDHPRPDLGRVREEGFIKGLARVLILDGRPLLSLKDKE